MMSRLQQTFNCSVIVKSKTILLEEPSILLETSIVLVKSKHRLISIFQPTQSALVKLLGSQMLALRVNSWQ
jgi:hypothetical protein